MIDLNDIAAVKTRHDLAAVKERLACTAAGVSTWDVAMALDELAQSAPALRVRKRAEAFLEKYGVPALDDEAMVRIEAEWRGEPPKKRRQRVA